MLVQVVDAQGGVHQVAWQGQDQINNFSGTLGAGAVGAGAAPQQIAPANVLRAGFLFQNTSANPMLVLEAGLAAAGWLVAPGAFFPPLPNYPIPTGIIYVQGLIPQQDGTQSRAGDAFTYREWQNADGE